MLRELVICVMILSAFAVTQNNDFVQLLIIVLTILAMVVRSFAQGRRSLSILINEYGAWRTSNSSNHSTLLGTTGTTTPAATSVWTSFTSPSGEYGTMSTWAWGTSVWTSFTSPPNDALTTTPDYSVDAAAATTAHVELTTLIPETSSINVLCYPNGTTIVTNPDPTRYVSARAEDTDERCTTRWVPNDDGSVYNALLEITGCDMSVSVLVSLSSRTDNADDIYGGSCVYSFPVKCNEIPLEGVGRTFPLGITVSYPLETAAVYPTFTVTSAMRSGVVNGSIQTSAVVGQMLYWTFDIPVEYTAVPTYCKAFAGTSTSGMPTRLLITDGCTHDSDLVDQFTDDKVDTSIMHLKRYWTTFWAFKFYANEHVFFHCRVKFCPPGSTLCNIGNCANRKRRMEIRREFGRSRKTKSTARDRENAVRFTTTSAVLRVIQRRPTHPVINSIASGNVFTPTSYVWICAVALLVKLIS